MHDTQTGYDAPSGLEVNWSGESRDGGKASAKLTVDKLGAVTGEGGLIEKVDVLAEIPFVIKKALSATTGIKPFIFQVGCADLTNGNVRLTSVPEPVYTRG